MHGYWMKFILISMHCLHELIAKANTRHHKAVSIKIFLCKKFPWPFLARQWYWNLG